MAEQQTIKFKISQDGTVTEEVQGTVGNECERLTKEIEEALGTVSGRIHKQEYYKSQNKVSDVTLQHNQDQTKG